MYHPAAALHQASLRETLFRDVRTLPAALLAAREALDAERSSVAATRQEPVEAAPTAPVASADEQMTLFEERA